MFGSDIYMHYGISSYRFSLDETITPSGGKTSNLTVKALGVNTNLYRCTASNKAGTSEKFTSYITVIKKGKHIPIINVSVKKHFLPWMGKLDKLGTFPYLHL